MVRDSTRRSCLTYSKYSGKLTPVQAVRRPGWVSGWRWSSNSTLQGMTVLVVDDSEDTTEMVRHLLEIGGAAVNVATSGFEALSLASEKEFDVVLSDISMPGMDGFEFIRKLRQLPGKEDVPAVALTGFGRPEDVQRASEEGFHAHLTKPFDIEMLATLLQNLPRTRAPGNP